MNEDLEEIMEAKMAGDHDKAERLWNHYKLQTAADVNMTKSLSQKARVTMRHAVMRCLEIV